MNLKKYDYVFVGIVSLAFMIELFRHQTIDIQYIILFGLLIMIISNQNDTIDIKKKIEEVK